MSRSPRLNIRSVKKYVCPDGNVSTRSKSLFDTFTEISPLCKNIGVTRISDITYMDKLYIPNYSVFLPGTQDSIWVYSGKGITKTHAKVSGLMESLERYCSLSTNYFKEYVRGTYSELSKSYHSVLHPDQVLEPVLQNYDTEKSTIDFVEGVDILNNEEVLVPAQLVLSKYLTTSPCVYAFPYSHTNGLASGNTLEEAICHALCEVIERDAASIADLCASSIPYTILTKIVNSLPDSNSNDVSHAQDHENKFVDDSSIFADINISQTDNKPINFLVKRFEESKISLLIKNITQKDIGIPTFVASSVEWMTSDYGYFAKGYGCHPDSKIALIRAITELSQTRAANIQGARDDLRKINYAENDEIYRTKWQFIPASSREKNSHTKTNMPFSQIKTKENRDIRDDVKYILKRLKIAGLKKVIIVDLTNPNLGVPVVRAVVPGLETFEVAKLFTSTELLMGKRAKACFQKIINS